MKNILITGGTGLVGAHLVEEILEQNPQARIVVLVYEIDAKSYFVTKRLDRRVRLVYGDIRSASIVRDAVFSYEVDTIFHLAAQPLVMAAYHSPLETWETNLMGTVHVMEAARTSPWVQAVVVASSDKAYGEPVFQPYTENHPLQALHPYDTSKAGTDMIARSYATCYGTPVVVTRFGNIYGPGDLHFNRIVPGAMRALALNEVLEIRSNGKLTRDYLYVKDVARIYLLLAARAKELSGRAFNCTSGVHLSVLEVLESVGRVVGTPVPYRILNNSTHEISSQSLSNDALKQTLGSVPSSELSQALQETWKWYQEFFSQSN